jgi:arylesterase/paraoxonase
MYLACAGSIESRTTWMPTLDALNATAARSRKLHDYIATYDIPTGKISKLDVKGFTESRGLNLHGMDVVVDEKDPNKLWVYLVNHRPPLDLNINPLYAGADSVIEVFTTYLGANHIDWIQTVEDSKVMVTPNDIVGGANGQEFWFTNDNGVKTGVVSSNYVICLASYRIMNPDCFISDARDSCNALAEIYICWLLPPEERLQGRLCTTLR